MEKVQTGEWGYTGGIVIETYQYTAETMPEPVVGKGYDMFPVRHYLDGEGNITYPPQWTEQELHVKP